MCNSRFVVAIDFGTSHSGFAYVHKSNPSEIEALYSWDHAPSPYSKTLTALLYDGKRNVTSWGYKAHHDYLTLSDYLRGSYTFVTKFKLFLDESYKIKPPEGLNVLILVADYLTYLKEIILNTLSLKFGPTFSKEEVQWCLTVPAMWSERAKNLMRIAALKSGIIESLMSTKLSMVLEPEAAAVHAAKHPQNAINDGDIFMVLDAGGGTVDLTLHRSHGENDEMKFFEVAPGLGKSCGATFVDNHFLDFFKVKVGEKVFNQVKEERPIEIFNLLNGWEAIKRNFRINQSKGSVYLPIPNFTYSIMSSKQKHMLEEEQDGFDDCIFLNENDILSFFDPVVKEILDLVDIMIKRSAMKVTKILCVGGFSDSKYLIHRIRDHLKTKSIEVICPPDPGAVVLKGAVQYGLKPSIISTRRSRLTYGIRCSQKWDESLPKSRRYWENHKNQWWVANVFSKFVEIEEEIKVDRKVLKNFSPMSSLHKHVLVSLYATKEKFPKFTDNENCYKLGEIRVPLRIDEDMDPDEYLISVSLQFGTTEIHVKVEKPDKNEEHHLFVNYDFDETILSSSSSICLR